MPAFLDRNWPVFLAEASAAIGRLIQGKPTLLGRREFLAAMKHVHRLAQNA